MDAADAKSQLNRLRRRVRKGKGQRVKCGGYPKVRKYGSFFETAGGGEGEGGGGQ